MNGFSLGDFSPAPSPYDSVDEDAYAALMADEQAPPVDEDQAIIDALIQQHQMRMQATLMYQKNSEEMNRMARMMHERAYRAG